MYCGEYWNATNPNTDIHINTRGFERIHHH
jgi:hypothetical protein